MSKEMLFLVKYTTAMAIGVPGTIGIFAVHEKWALPISEILK
jgi:hypothetical protein